MDDFKIELLNQTLMLSASKVAFWVEERMLIVSDVHLGKAAHFRKSGIPIPTEIHSQDLLKLDYLINKYQPVTVTFLGDLFHSDHNEEWSAFTVWLDRHKAIDTILVKGNHDILSQHAYELPNLKIIDEWQLGPFHLTHQEVKSNFYNISGHVHPAIWLTGNARQGLRLPCFYFTERKAIFPAFGNFTGGYAIKPAKKSKIYAVAEDRIIALMG